MSGIEYLNRRSGRVVECTGLENQRTARYRGFESLLLRNGLVVQLVRIHACHAWGREFESRPDRQQMSLSPVHPRIAGLLVARVFTSVLTFMNRVRE